MNRRERNSGKLRKLATTGILAGIMLFLALTIFAVIPLMGASPVYVIIMSLGARLLIPVTVWLIDKAFKKHVVAGNIVSSAAGSLTNTVFYLGLMLLFYVMAGIDSATVLGVIAGVGALNGSLEAIACMVVCPPVVYALRKSFLKKTA